MSHNVLLVEDSKEVYRMVDQALSSSLLNLDWATTVSDAQNLLNKNNYDLVLLDIELPDGSGIDLCSKIQFDTPSLPIFFLSSHDELSDKVLGFSAGADDYITKPFNILELKSRVEAKLKKIALLKEVSDLLSWKEITINKSTQEVNILNENDFTLVELTALEFKLLTYFASKVGQVIDRDTMLNDIWGKDVHVYARSVDTHVSKLRKKLGDVSHIVESVHGAGYKFNPTQQ